MEFLKFPIWPRSSLETTKLELLSEVSGLKLRQVFRSNKVHVSMKKNFQTTTEKENEELRRQLAKTLRLAENGQDGFRCRLRSFRIDIYWL